jgi:NAD(P)-dependent dehydrogenase (short-subunit alcohol dehydrogenase family)
MFDLSGKLALVTGAGQNAGKGISEALAGQGATVLVNDIVAERAEATAAEIRQAGGKAAACAFDVTDLEGVKAAVAAACKAQGRTIDILVNNAGNGGAQGMKMQPFREMDPSKWRGPIDVNLYGVLNCTHAVLSDMVANKWGRIITIASGAGTHGLDIGVSPYAAGKGGAIGFMRHMAMENGPFGVTANTIALGLIIQIASPEVEALAKRLPTKRKGNPKDVGALCVYLASEESEWFTGQTLQLNGGAITT